MQLDIIPLEVDLQLDMIPQEVDMQLDMIPHDLGQLVEHIVLPHTSPSLIRSKRKARGKTPIVDDEVRRSSRFRNDERPVHM